MLNGTIVVDASTGMSGALTGKLLAELGARVIRIVPPGGDPFTNIHPAYPAWQCAKEEVDYESDATFESLLCSADACIVGGDDHPDIAWRPDVTALRERIRVW